MEERGTIGPDYSSITTYEERIVLNDRSWSDMEAELKCEPPRFNRIKKFLIYMRDVLLVMFKEQRQMITDTIDVPHIMQQLSAGAFDWASTVRLVSSIMLIMRAVEKQERHAAFDSAWR